MNKLLSLLALATFAFGQDPTVPSYDVKVGVGIGPRGWNPAGTRRPASPDTLTTTLTLDHSPTRPLARSHSLNSCFFAFRAAGRAKPYALTRPPPISPPLTLTHVPPLPLRSVSQSTVSMLNMTASYKDDKAVFEAEASKACFDFCATTVSTADVRANWFNKSNRRKNRVQCKCLMKDSVETPLTMTCEDLPDPSMEELAGNSPAGKGNGKGKGKGNGKGKGKGKGQGMGRKLLKKGGKGKLKKCLKCHALSGTPPVTPPPTV